MLERKARECFKRGDYRRAMEGYKRLMRLDAAAHREAFAASCLHVFEEALRKGQIRSAEIVLRDLAEAAPERQLAVFRLRLALAMGEEGEAASAASILLSSPEVPPEERRYAADAVVALAPESRRHLVWTEPGLIDRALEAAADGRFAEAGSVLREIPRDSAFAHWRLFFKAVAADAEGDRRTAEQALSRLGGPSAGLARAWIEPDTASLATAVALQGEAKLAENLPSLVRADARGDRLTVLARLVELGGDFPAQGRGIGSTLTDYLFARLQGTEIDERAVAGLLKKARRAGASPFTLFALARLLHDYLAGDPYLEPREARLIEGAIPEARAAFPAQADAAEAIVADKYGRILRKNGSEIGRGYQLRMAADFLKRATKAAPGWEPPVLELLLCYMELKQTKECDALLKDALKRFPESLDVLYRAGQVSMLRDRPKAALRYFLDILKRDPLNEKARRDLVDAAVDACGDALCRKARDEATKSADIAIENARASLGYIKSPDKVLLQIGNLFEGSLGAAAAKPYYDRAAGILEPDVYAYLRFVTFFLTRWQARRPAKCYSLPAPFGSEATLAQTFAMLEFLARMETMLGDEELEHCEKKLVAYAGAALRLDADWRVNAIPLVRSLLELEICDPVLRALAEGAKKRAPGDPLAEVLDIAAGLRVSKRSRLGQLRADFVAEGFTAAVALCDAIEKKLEESAHRGHFLPPQFEGVWDDPGGPPFSAEQIRDVVETLAELARRKPPKKPKASAGKPRRKKAAKRKVPEAEPESPPRSPEEPRSSRGQLDLPF